jgi:hypothetical protein
MPGVLHRDHLGLIGVVQEELFEPRLLGGSKHRLGGVVRGGVNRPVGAAIQEDEPHPANTLGMVETIRGLERVVRHPLPVDVLSSRVA